MMRAVLRVVLLCAVLAAGLSGQTLDEAVRALAKRVASRLAPQDVPRVAARSMSNLGSAEAVKARAVFERAIKRPAPRAPQIVDVALTIAQNVRGYLLVAEFERYGQKTVEMEPFAWGVAAPLTRVVLERELLIELDAPILDAVAAGERFYVLEPDALVVYARTGGKMDRVETRAVENRCVRDPRGRIDVQGEAVSVAAPGQGSPFHIAGQTVKFAETGNTLVIEAWPAFYSYARAGDLHLVAEADGRVHVYDSERRPSGIIENWGADIASSDATCGTVLATSAGDRDQADSITAFDFVDRRPVAASEPMQFAGPVTALWANADGALAVSRNNVTGKYAAYKITIRRSR